MREPESVTVLIVDVATSTAKSMDLPATRAGRTLLLPEMHRGVLRSAVFEPLQLADKRGRRCWIYVRAE